MGDSINKCDAGVAARRLIRGREYASLGTLLEGRPYVSLVATACDHEAVPLLLLSDLAQHTKTCSRSGGSHCCSKPPPNTRTRWPDRA